MLDPTVRRLIDLPLHFVGRNVARAGLGADHLTFLGLAFGLAAAIAIYLGAFGWALLACLMNRACDGLDGAVARMMGLTDRGGFLDVALDFIFYASVPVAFAFYAPDANALPAAVLLATFLINGSAFLAFAVIAERNEMTTTVQGRKSFYFLAGLAGGTETVIAFVAFCLFPTFFPWLAFAFAGLCLTSGIGRIAYAYEVFRPDH